MALLFCSRSQEMDSGKEKQVTRGLVYSYCEKECSTESFFVRGKVSSLYICGQWKGICSLSSVILLKYCELGLTIFPQGLSCETDCVGLAEVAEDPLVCPQKLYGYLSFEFLSYLRS